MALCPAPAAHDLGDINSWDSQNMPPCHTHRHSCLPDNLFLSQSGQVELNCLNIYLLCTCYVQYAIQAGASPAGCLPQALSHLDPPDAC